MPGRYLTIPSNFVVGPEMESLLAIVYGAKAPVAGGNGGQIQGRAALTPGETIYANSQSGCAGGANGSGGPGVGRAGGLMNWLSRTSDVKANAFLLAAGGGGRGGGAGSGGGAGGATLHTEATGSTNCTAGAAGNIGQGGGGGGGRGWVGGAGGGANAGNGSGGSNMYRTTVVAPASVISQSGVITSTTGTILIVWSRSITGLVSDTGTGELACCGAMI